MCKPNESIKNIINFLPKERSSTLNANKVGNKVQIHVPMQQAIPTILCYLPNKPGTILCLAAVQQLI